MAEDEQAVESVEKAVNGVHLENGEAEDYAIVARGKRRAARKEHKLKKIQKIQKLVDKHVPWLKYGTNTTILRHKRSPLGKVDMRKEVIKIVKCGLWRLLPFSAKMSIVDTFPDRTEIIDYGLPSVRLDIEKLKSNDDFRRDCGKYTSRIREGFFNYHDLGRMQLAHERRIAGDLDEHLRTVFTTRWGIAMSPNVWHMYGPDGQPRPEAIEEMKRIDEEARNNRSEGATTTTPAVDEAEEDEEDNEGAAKTPKPKTSKRKASDFLLPPNSAPPTSRQRLSERTSDPFFDLSELEDSSDPDSPTDFP